MAYAKVDIELVRDIGAGAMPGGATLADAEPAPDVPSDEYAIAWRRRQAPMGEPLPITFKWIAKLPRRVRPFALLRQYPRIANMIAAMWHDPQSCHAYIHDLLTDRRGNRKGFPPEIVQDVLTLRVHFEQLHPGMLDACKVADKQA
ncbi:MAG TPA: hypothetical protein VGK37_10045 [Casimicrobiaceae bacterium]|jgi:hypothetical protein